MHKNKVFLIAFVIVLLAAVYLFHPWILRQMGTYLAPSETAKADAAIIEGNTTIDNAAVKEAIACLNAGKVKRIVLVVHEVTDGEKIFSLPEQYSRLIYASLLKTGLKTSEFQILLFHVEEPVTLSEAQYVLTHLSKDNMKRAILIAKSFHTRRSLLAYRHVGKSLNFTVIPLPYYVGYRPETWWLKADGFRDFFPEAFKLIYYILRGYIPVKSLFTLNI